MRKSTNIVRSLGFFCSGLIFGSLFDVRLGRVSLIRDEDDEQKLTFFSSSSSSFHLAPSSLPTSPMVANKVRKKHGFQKKVRPTKASIRVLGLDPITPVLAEEHVRRECAFRLVGILLPFARCSFIRFFRSFTLERRGERQRRRRCLTIFPNDSLWAWWPPLASVESHEKRKRNDEYMTVREIR